MAAFHAALAECTRERVTLDWAMTQNNLGIALRILGERESGTARREKAVAANHAALTEYTRERAPLYWAMTQSNLADALWVLGERESGTARLEEAVQAIILSRSEYHSAGIAQFYAHFDKLLDTIDALIAERGGPRAASTCFASRTPPRFDWINHMRSIPPLIPGDDIQICVH
ncbi:tetratricopeptide repeat protein [Paraburkholderia youngii]|uniref:tetratricopeptide repeat protein n=1 Tax=Paraburkholderia youngii TaxID=2782701 RepID=UPI001C3C2AF5|nr:tetratricopeptide repeat protein [Paraburkholderia youngii]